MFYTVHWTQPDGPTEMDFVEYQSAQAFLDCLHSSAKPYMRAETDELEPAQLYQVHEHRRGIYSDTVVWCALRPEPGSYNPGRASFRKPYLYSKHEAEQKIKELVYQGTDPENLRMVWV